jgi:hypothetical protein
LHFASEISHFIGAGRQIKICKLLVAKQINSHFIGAGRQIKICKLLVAKQINSPHLSLFRYAKKQTKICIRKAESAILSAHSAR